MFALSASSSQPRGKRCFGSEVAKTNQIPRKTWGIWTDLVFSSYIFLAKKLGNICVVFVGWSWWKFVSLKSADFGWILEVDSVAENSWTIASVNRMVKKKLDALMGLILISSFMMIMMIHVRFTLNFKLLVSSKLVFFCRHHDHFYGKSYGWVMFRWHADVSAICQEISSLINKW